MRLKSCKMLLFSLILSMQFLNAEEKYPYDRRYHIHKIKEIHEKLGEIQENLEKIDKNSKEIHHTLKEINDIVKQYRLYPVIPFARPRVENCDN